MPNAWEIGANDVANQLDVDLTQGLNVEEVKKRLKEVGPNKIQIGKKKSGWVILFKQFKSPIIYLLVLAIMISFFLHEYIEGISILIILLINAVIGFFQEFKAESSLQKLAELSSPHGRVKRNATILEVLSSEIVPGDILFLEAGDYVVADARIIEGNELASDEALLTGESLPVSKQSSPLPEDKDLAERTNMIFAGTAIARGNGLAIVTATGEKTEMGKIAGLLKRKEKNLTPIQIRLEILGRYLLYAALVIILLIFAVGIIEKRELEEILMSALSLSIAVIPEGLPAMVTIALLIAVFRMSKKGALVRRLDAVETLGATDVICTDKTGTLTYGKMEVENVFALNPNEQDLMILNMALCNNASLAEKDSGDSTEIALLKYAKNIPDMNERISGYTRIKEWPFDSDRKRMSVAVKKSSDEIFIFTKGAPESVMPNCISGLNSRIDKYLQEETRLGKRLLAFAFKKITLEEFKSLDHQSPEIRLHFTGLSSLSDQLREETKMAIQRCLKAGIKVIMITGDHPATAQTIARNLEIGSGKEEEILTGKDLDKMNEDDLKLKIDKIFVFARVTSEQKYKIVSALLKKDHIVAMTGDGVNDAPALKKASVGVSMGRAGTEVARQASSMVLTNDDFATIVAAIEEGRGIFGNLKRTLQYLLSTNLAELLLIFSAMFLGLPVPLLPINILWINLVTDGFPALALASERVPENYLTESDRPSMKSFFDRKFHQELLLVGIVITLFGLSIYYFSLKNYSLNIARSFVFSFMVYAILFRSFTCRSSNKAVWQLKMNWVHLLSVIFPLLFQIFFQYSDSLRKIFNVDFISINQHLFLIVLSLIPVLILEISKVWFIQTKNQDRPLNY